MKRFVLAFSILSSASGFAYQGPCSVSGDRYADLVLTASGEQVFQGGGFDEIVDARKAAYANALKNLDKYASECAFACDANRRFFAMGDISSSCNFASEKSNVLVCSLKAPVFCQ